MSEKSEKSRKNAVGDGKIPERDGLVVCDFGMGWPKVSGFVANFLAARQKVMPLKRL